MNFLNQSHHLDFLGLDDDGLHAPGLCSFGGGPSGNTTSTQTSTPWSGQQGYLTDIYSQASNLDQNATPQYYPNATYQPLTPVQQGLMSNLIGYTGLGGGSAIQAANQNLTGTLSPSFTNQTQGTFDQGSKVLGSELMSNYLDPNNSPYYRTAVSNALASALPAASASFINGNRSDSGLATAAETSAAANAAAGLAQNQYNTNQGIQQNAVGQSATDLMTQQGLQGRNALVAPVVDQGIAGNLSTALNTAGMSQTDIQNQINANIAKYNYGQMLPWNQLGLYESAVTGTGSPGGTTTTQQPYYSNTGANVLAGVGTAASLAASAAVII